MEEQSVFLTRDAFLKERDELAIKKVELTRGHVFVREMTGYEKDIFERSMMRKLPQGDKNAAVTNYETILDQYKAKLAVSTMCDENGKLLFIMADVPVLIKNMSATNLEKVANAASEINLIKKEDKDELVKNLEAESTDSSSSDSAESSE